MKSSNKFLNLPKSKIINGKSYHYISYSQYSSFNETSDEFRYQMILNYIFGIKIPSRFQIFADYGSHCGEYIETQGKKRGDLLSDNDCVILDNVVIGKNCTIFPNVSIRENCVLGNHIIIQMALLSGAMALDLPRVGKNTRKFLKGVASLSKITLKLAQIVQLTGLLLVKPSFRRDVN